MLLKTAFEQKVADIILKLRWVIVAVAVILTALFGYGFSVLQFKVTLEDMLPPANPFVKLNAEFGNRFGGLTYFSIQVGADKEDLFTPQRLKTLVEITDDMSPDEKRQARIANSKAKSAFNKTLKAAGVDPKSVKY